MLALRVPACYVKVSACALLCVLVSAIALRVPACYVKVSACALLCAGKCCSSACACLLRACPCLRVSACVLHACMQLAAAGASLAVEPNMHGTAKKMLRTMRFKGRDILHITVAMCTYKPVFVIRQKPSKQKKLIDAGPATKVGLHFAWSCESCKQL